ncbi:MAG: addiction module toxin, HicA family [Acidobacteria bacterium]|nr:addiction module toxin, HicA family [Acidobacteriota bacterium]
MKRRALVAHLKSHGCELHREGSRHSIFRNTATGAIAPVPRHAEIDDRLILEICKQLGIPHLSGT